MQKRILFTIMMLLFAAIVIDSSAFADKSDDDQNKDAVWKVATVEGWWPINNTINNNGDVITSPFGPRWLSTTDPYNFHHGIDIEADHRPVHAAFDGTLWVVNARSDNREESNVFIRHIDPGDPNDPDDDTTFYTFYTHLHYTSQLAELDAFEGQAQIDAGVFNQQWTDPNTGFSYIVNPFAESGNSGLGYSFDGSEDAHLHFSGLVDGLSETNNAINPMRNDSLPYNNTSAPAIQNAQLNLISGSSQYRVTFRVSTHHQQLDLNTIELFDGLDAVQINFDNRTNTDAAGSPDPNNRNEDGVISTKTSFDRDITIRITTNKFSKGANQIMDFAFDLPTQWNGYPITITAYDTQDLWNQVVVIVTRVEDDKDTSTLPSAYLLLQNFPNPFNPSTTIRFALPKKSLVSLAIFNVHGGLVRELVTQKVYDPAWGELVWDGTNAAGLPVASGAYFYRLTAESLDYNKRFSQTKKLMLLK